MKRPPLPFARKSTWHSRWLVLRSWNRLHRVVEVDEYEKYKRHGVNGDAVTGVTACGRRGRLSMPGVCSRLGLERCVHCCRKVGVPEGNGAPYNKGMNA